MSRPPRRRPRHDGVARCARCQARPRTSAFRRRRRANPAKPSHGAAIALAILSTPASADTIPVRPGFYARADRPCATHGDAAAHATLLHVDGDGVSDSGHARTVVHMREENGALVVDQWSRDLREGGEKASLSWVVRIMEPQTSLLLGADAGVDWSGHWRWCGDAIP